jgi:hypothetical protein
MIVGGVDVLEFPSVSVGALSFLVQKSATRNMLAITDATLTWRERKNVILPPGTGKKGINILSG